jgi:hypothetical protein
LHGTTPGLCVIVRDMVARISVRVPVAPELLNGKLTDWMTPLATVNGVAEPITVPLEFRNVTVPVQDAAAGTPTQGPMHERRGDAIFTRLICAVSELASPTGGVFDISVTVPVVVV